MSSELHRFGIDDDDEKPDRRWKKGVNRILRALITNPSLNFGTNNSEIIFPETLSARKQAAESGASSGAFCSTYELDGDTYIRGGNIRYGNIHTATVADYQITGTGDFNLYVKCTLVAKRSEPDHDYFLFGIESTPDGDELTMDDQATGYPAGVDPDLTDGEGEIICDIGRVRFDADDLPIFSPTGCGNFQLKHCGGELTYARV